MDLRPTSDQDILRRTVREFAEAEIGPHVMEWDEAQKMPESLLPKMAALGLMGIQFPDTYGGAGMSAVDYCICIEELARVCPAVSLSVAAHNGLCTSHLFMFGSDAQKQRYLGPLVRGEYLGAWGLTEANAGSDAAAMKTKARRDGDGWVLNGSKQFITHGATGGVMVAMAVTDRTKAHRGISAFVIERGTQGLIAGKKENKLGMRASDTSEVIFQDCRIGADALVGEEGQGFINTLTVLDAGRIGIAALAVGLAQGAYEAACRYAKSRKQFGQPIARFQAIQWKLADLAAKIEAARLLTYRAAWLKDAGVARMTKESAMAKLYASEVAVRAADECVQIHGGYGFVKDYPAEKFFRDVKLCTIGEGTSEIQRLVIARQLLARMTGATLSARILARDPRAIARAISLIEDESPDGAALIGAIYPHTGRAYLIGVTGPPGAGKSTLVDRLIAGIRASGRTVGVLAVDPTSPFSGGAILGDRVRMQTHAQDDGVFIRSMATRGHLGGLARTTAEAALVLDAAGYDVVIVETVGVGQDEVDIVRSADVSIVTLVPGTGDEVQALKAGIMEIADIFVVNKADREGADRTAASIEMMLALESFENGEWRPPVLRTEATAGKGIAELLSMIETFRERSTPSVGARRRARAEWRLREILSRSFMQHLERSVLEPGEFAAIVDRIERRDVDPYGAADDVMGRALGRRGRIHPAQTESANGAPPVMDYIGIAVADVAAALGFFTEVMGLPAEQPEALPERGVQVRFVGAHETKIELVEALSPESGVGKFIAKRGPGLHHIAFRVSDIVATLAALKARGIRLVDEEPRIGAHGSRIAFVHPSAAHGVLVELKQPGPGNDAEASRMKIGDLELHSLSDGFFRLDGGAMFGVVPKPMWEKRAQADERNRILLAMRPLLVRTPDRLVLIDSGAGDKMSAKLADIYGLDRTTHLDHSLAALGLSAADIDVVIATHLHFDHMGGGTALIDGEVRPRFPRARYKIRRGEWHDATHTHERNRASYFPENFLPLETAGVVDFHDDDAELVPGIPGITVWRTGGHALNHQIVRVVAGGRAVWFVADLIPTTAHIDDPWIMGYDLYPMETLAYKKRFIREAIEREYIVCFEHDPVTAAGIIRERDGRRYVEPVDLS